MHVSLQLRSPVRNFVDDSEYEGGISGAETRKEQKIIRNKDVFTGLLLQDVQQLGRDLMDEGVLKISPLEWDGALGPREVEIIERLGFLLDAYDASVWYWEVKIQTPLLLCWC